MKRKSKSNGRIILVSLFLLVAMTASVVLSSCDVDWNLAQGLITTPNKDDTATATDSGLNFSDVAGFAVDDEGHLVLHLGDGTELELNVKGNETDAGTTVTVPTEVNHNEITVNIGDGAADLTYAASKALMSVVSVWCKYERKVSYYQGYSWIPGYGSGRQTTETYQTAGSGVIFKLDKESGDAYIITNFHVVYDSDSLTSDGISDDIKVYLYGSESSDMAIPATFVGGSLYYDIAILKVTGSTVLQQSIAEAVELGNSDVVAAGQVAMAVGNPEAEGISVTSGVVSVPSEYITMTGADNSTTVSFRVIRVDTAVNSGNSGGGLFDATGNLIGIVNAKISDSEVENIGYAIPTSVVRAIADNILFYCDGQNCKRVQRGMLGITVQSSSSHAVINPETGLIGIEEYVSVAEVNEGGLADGVLQAGDVIRSITLGGRTVQVTRQYHVIDAMLDARVGSDVTMEIIRGGETMTVTMTVTEDDLTAY